ncbi:MAG: choice-of-anchor D domain-containing protein [Caldilineaceae bacterium]
MRKATHSSPIDLSFTALRILLAISVVLPLFISPALASVAHASGETVVTTTSLANDPNDGACSLREALQAAFSQWSNGTAAQKYNECTAYAGPTTIIFSGNATAGVIKLTADQDPLPMITKAVTIIGPVIIQGGGVPAANATQRDTRLFRVASSGVLTLMSLTLKDGYVGGFGGAIFSNSADSVINLYGVSLVGNAAEGDGGAIATNGELNVVLSNFSGNRALGINGPNHAPADGYGGAIKMDGSNKLNLSQSNFSGNIANRGGGALAVIGATALISDTVFNGNIAQATVEDSGGGALYSNQNGNFSVIRTYFNGNLSPKGRGGAIYNAIGAAPSIIVDSAFTANISGDLVQNGQGGALYNETALDIQRVTFNANIASPGKDENANDLPGLGGALLNNHGALLKLTNSSFFANLAPQGKGGAVANIDSPNPVSSDSTIEIRNNTFSNNGADSAGAIYNEEKVALWNTIIDVGSVGAGGTCGGPKAVTDNGYNLQNPDKNCGATMVEADPKLDLPKPAHSGGLLGWLLVQSPNEGSPAIDQGDDAVCNIEPVNKLDETNGERPADGDNDGIAQCDIGAVEVGRGLPGYGSEPAQPGPITFGNVKVGTTAEASFEIFETGKLPLAVLLDPTGELSGPNAADFAVVPGIFPIALFNNAPRKTVTLRCTPSAPGLRTAKLSLVSDDPFHLTIDYELSCNGTVDKTLALPPTRLHRDRLIWGRVWLVHR